MAAAVARSCSLELPSCEPSLLTLIRRQWGDASDDSRPSSAQQERAGLPALHVVVASEHSTIDARTSSPFAFSHSPAATRGHANQQHHFSSGGMEPTLPSWLHHAAVSASPTNQPAASVAPTAVSPQVEQPCAPVEEEAHVMLDTAARALAALEVQGESDAAGNDNAGSSPSSHPFPPSPPAPHAQTTPRSLTDHSSSATAASTAHPPSAAAPSPPPTATTRSRSAKLHLALPADPEEPAVGHAPSPSGSTSPFSPPGCATALSPTTMQRRTSSRALVPTIRSRPRSLCQSCDNVSWGDDDAGCADDDQDDGSLPLPRLAAAAAAAGPTGPAPRPRRATMHGTGEGELGRSDRPAAHFGNEDVRLEAAQQQTVFSPKAPMYPPPRRARSRAVSEDGSRRPVAAATAVQSPSISTSNSRAGMPLTPTSTMQRTNANSGAPSAAAATCSLAAQVTAATLGLPALISTKEAHTGSSFRQQHRHLRTTTTPSPDNSDHHLATTTPVAHPPARPPTASSGQPHAGALPVPLPMAPHPSHAAKPPVMGGPVRGDAASGPGGVAAANHASRRWGRSTSSTDSHAASEAVLGADRNVVERGGRQGYQRSSSTKERGAKAGWAGMAEYAEVEIMGGLG